VLATFGESVGIFDDPEIGGAYHEVFRFDASRLSHLAPMYSIELAQIVGRGRERAGITIGHEALAEELRGRNGVYYLARQSLPNGEEGWVAYGFSEHDPALETRGPHIINDLEAVDFDFGERSCRRGAAAILHAMLRNANESDQVLLKSRERGEETRSDEFFASTAFRGLKMRFAKRRSSGLYRARVGDVRDAILLNYDIGPEPSS